MRTTAISDSRGHAFTTGNVLAAEYEDIQVSDFSKTSHQIDAELLR